MAKYNNYKDTGIPWIGQIPLEWEVKRNKNVFSCNKNIVGSESSSTQLLSLTTNGIRKKNIDETGGKIPESYDTYQHVKANDIVMCLFDLDCSAVFSGLSKCDGMISPAYKILRCNESIMPGFADYWFRSVFVGRKFKYLAKNIRYSLTYEDFSALEIPCPTLIEQKAIVDYLDCVCSNVDSIIAEAQASIEEYKAWKSSIIYEAVTKGLDPNVEMRDSGVEWVGKMPKTWSTCALKLLTTKIGSGKTPSGGAEVYTSEGVMFLRSQNIYNTGLEIDSVSFISNEIDESMSSTRVKYEDVLLNITGGSIGRCCLYDLKGIPANVNQHVCILRTDKTKLLPQYLRYFWNSASGPMVVAQYQTGGNRQGLNFEQIGSTKIPFCSIEEQKNIVDYLDIRCGEIDTLIKEKEVLISDLESYKKSLIFEVVTGKRKVV